MALCTPCSAEAEHVARRDDEWTRPSTTTAFYKPHAWQVGSQADMRMYFDCAKVNFACISQARPGLPVCLEAAALQPLEVPAVVSSELLRAKMTADKVAAL